MWGGWDPTQRWRRGMMRVRTSKLMEMKQAGEPIVCVTAYDYSMARLVDEAGIPVVLVGDSLGNVVPGLRLHHPGDAGRRASPHACGRARHEGRPDRGGHAVHDLQRDRGGRAAQRRSTVTGGRRAGREAGGRRVRRGDRAPSHGDRHPRHGSPRAHAAVCPPVGRLPRAGTHR